MFVYLILRQQILRQQPNGISHPLLWLTVSPAHFLGVPTIAEFHRHLRHRRGRQRPTIEIYGRVLSLISPPHTIPLRNSSKEYFVPLHTIPSFHSVRNIERRSVYVNMAVLTGCRKK